MALDHDRGTVKSHAPLRATTTRAIAAGNP
jgi:hypothetical protein